MQAGQRSLPTLDRLGVRAGRQMRAGPNALQEERAVLAGEPEQPGRAPTIPDPQRRGLRRRARFVCHHFEDGITTPLVCTGEHTRGLPAGQRLPDLERPPASAAFEDCCQAAVPIRSHRLGRAPSGVPPDWANTTVRSQSTGLAIQPTLPVETCHARQTGAPPDTLFTGSRPPAARTVLRTALRRRPAHCASPAR